MNLQSIVKTILSPLLIIIGFGVIGALTGHILSYLAVSSLEVFFSSNTINRLIRSLQTTASQAVSKWWWDKVSLSIYLSSLLVLFLGRYSSILLAFFASNTEIDNFNVATTLSAVLNILIFPLSVSFPTFSKLKPNSGLLWKRFDEDEIVRSS